jgi:hypothetical protein
VLIGTFVVGCDRSGVGRVVPVKGIVTIDGKPLTTGSLVFKPDAGKGNQSTFEPAGQIGADGSYELFTGPKEGAPLGWYNIGVVAQELNAADPYAAPKSLIPAKYADAVSSGVAIEVVENPAAGAYDIRLTK